MFALVGLINTVFIKIGLYIFIPKAGRSINSTQTPSTIQKESKIPLPDFITGSEYLISKTREITYTVYIAIFTSSRNPSFEQRICQDQFPRI